ncbi:MAG: hypothetical protein QOI42_353 [Frankiaceae bacterium]|jgi:hypothetical protein|nr:hypothetical protein [Frankiaceae bacterium]
MTEIREPDESLDLQAIAADDALLDRLGGRAPAADDTTDALTWDGAVDQPPAEATGALTWDGSVEQPPAEISDAIIWTDEPVRPPTGTPVKKNGSQSSDDVERAFLALLADIDDGLAASAERLRDVPLLAAVADTGTPSALPAGSSARAWARVARRTGTRGLAAAAAVVVSLGGVAAASVAAGPGNPLYPVHKLFVGSDVAKEQAYAAGRVSTALDEAQRALDAHRVGLAHGKVTSAGSLLKAVDAGPVKDALVTRHDALAALVAAQMPSTDPGPGTTPGSPTLTPSPSGSTGSGSTTGPTDGTTGTPGGSATSTHPDDTHPGKVGNGNGNDKSASDGTGKTNGKTNGNGGHGDGQTDGTDQSGGATSVGSSDGHSKTGGKTSGTGDSGSSGGVQASPSPTTTKAHTTTRRHRSTKPKSAATNESGSSGSGTSIKLPTSGSTGSLD